VRQQALPAEPFPQLLGDMRRERLQQLGEAQQLAGQITARLVDVYGRPNGGVQLAEFKKQLGLQTFI
jgi:hypothetical protein